MFIQIENKSKWSNIILYIPNITSNKNVIFIFFSVGLLHLFIIPGKYKVVSQFYSQPLPVSTFYDILFI